MLDLPDLTLVAVYTVAHELTEMAIADCTRHVRFGDVKLFTDRPLRSQGDAIQIEPFSDLKRAGEFTTYEVPRHIRTSHALFIHWDSWIVDPSMWRPQFLDCDYIGAPWWYRDGLNVGNSGFCIRSKALIDFLAAHPAEFPLASPEDEVLCRHYRPRLPQFKWADEALAHEFSFERTRAGPGARSFGFHGMFNWPFVLTEAQIEARVMRATGYVLGSQHCREMRAVLAARQSAHTKEPAQPPAVIGRASPVEGPRVVTSSKLSTGLNVGRNEPCPCGGGKKYKKCCGSLLSHAI